MSGWPGMWIDPGAETATGTQVDPGAGTISGVPSRTGLVSVHVAYTGWWRWQWLRLRRWRYSRRLI